MIYLIGSLRNPQVPVVAEQLRNAGHEVFDDWYAAGPEADDYWQRYEVARGHNFKQALEGYAANHVYGYDKGHLDRADSGVLLMPAGKSAHLELGYLIGQGKPGYILMNAEPERFDVMYRFATVVFSVEELLRHIQCSVQGSTSTPLTNPLDALTPEQRSEWTKSMAFGSSLEKSAPLTVIAQRRLESESLASSRRNHALTLGQTSSSTQEAISSS